MQLYHPEPAPRRETMRALLARRITSLMGGAKSACDEDGPCFGVAKVSFHMLNFWF
jgi:ZIP family zinc transporter